MVVVMAAGYKNISVPECGNNQERDTIGSTSLWYAQLSAQFCFQPKLRLGKSGHGLGSRCKQLVYIESDEFAKTSQ
jgi:hypothetical protein